MNHVPFPDSRPDESDDGFHHQDQQMFEGGLKSRRQFLDRPVLAVLTISLLVTLAAGALVAYFQLN